MTTQLMSQNLLIVSSPFRIFCVLCHPNHFVLAYRFLTAPVQANQDFFYIDCMTVYFRASDRVRQKMGNSAAFSREIMRQERSIMRQIMRFF